MNDVEILITNRVDETDWKSIRTHSDFFVFLRNRVVVYVEDIAKNDNGDPLFWSIIDWVDENASDLWYLDNNSFYFYADEDIVAFKLRWL